MFLAMEPQIARIYVSSQAQGLFKPSDHLIRVRKIALRDENVSFWCANAFRYAFSDARRREVVGDDAACSATSPSRWRRGG